MSSDTEKLQKKRKRSQERTQICPISVILVVQVVPVRVILRSPGFNIFRVRLPALLGLVQSLLALFAIVEITKIFDLAMGGMH